MSTAFIQADTKPIIGVTLKDRSTNAPLDLSGVAQVILRFALDDGRVYERQMFVDDAEAGHAVYQFGADELQPPTITLEVKVVYVDGLMLSTLGTKTLGVRALVGSV